MDARTYLDRAQAYAHLANRYPRHTYLYWDEARKAVADLQEVLALTDEPDVRQQAADELQKLGMWSLRIWSRLAGWKTWAVRGGGRGGGRGDRPPTG